MEYERRMAKLADLFGAALHKRADELRLRAITADQQRDVIADEIVDRWASSFATAYQTLLGAAHACGDVAAILRNDLP